MLQAEDGDGRRWKKGGIRNEREIRSDDDCRLNLRE